jgi:NADH dehydrogenase (ubiquinone) 1 beta subcomplex subunit 3
MFLKPIKFEQNVVSPPSDIKNLSDEMFNRILTNYKENYSKFKANPLGNVNKDPWFRREAWRWDPYFSKENVFRRAFPGLGLAAVAFSVYLVYDFMVEGEKKSH